MAEGQAGYSPEEAADRATKPQDSVDSSPDERTAGDAADRASPELEELRRAYRRVRRHAARQLRRIREATDDDVLDGAMKLVRRHPGPSVVLALLIGFFVGRASRR